MSTVPVSVQYTLYDGREERVVAWITEVVRREIGTSRVPLAPVGTAVDFAGTRGWVVEVVGQGDTWTVRCER